jgi:hypothetical protein
MVNNSHQYQQSEQSIGRSFDIDRIVDHHCLEVIVRFVDIREIVDHHSLEMTVRFVDIGVNC